MLQIKNLCKTYPGGKKAVDHLNLEIAPGDIYGFIGHNGAGKTTTIKAITGIIDFEEGEILVDGVSVRKDPLTCKRKIAYIPDNPDLYEYLTGIQYLNFIGDIFQVPVSEREERIRKYGELFELMPALGDLISSYSHGMKQKLAIISALLHKPSLMILDEPFVGLDPKASVLLKEVMRQMCEEGTAIFFSTHVLEVAEKLCNKVAIIKDGKLVLAGRTQAIIGNQSLESLFMELEEK
ncbi:MAG: ABC transporter ATP-binding protein [Lachnospiraceae bacterium]|nr:ABC transporter ATP-binding protein [Lachnospiraceae bacterium]